MASLASTSTIRYSYCSFMASDLGLGCGACGKCNVASELTNLHSRSNCWCALYWYVRYSYHIVPYLYVHTVRTYERIAV